MTTLNHGCDEASRLRLGEEIECRGSRIDWLQGRVADKLRQTSETLFGKVDNYQFAPGAHDIKSRARSWLNQSADYIERIEPEQLRADVTNQVRRNPGASLLLAGAAGLILGTIFRRR